MCDPCGVTIHKLRATILEYLEEASCTYTLILALPEGIKVSTR